MIYVGIDIASTKHDFIMLNDDGILYILILLDLFPTKHHSIKILSLSI